MDVFLYIVGLAIPAAAITYLLRRKLAKKNQKNDKPASPPQDAADDGYWGTEGHADRADDDDRGGARGAWARFFTPARLIPRAGATWAWLRRWEKPQLAVLAAAFLATAQFFTTAKGLSSFIPWLTVAVMAAIGVQVILYLSAWLVAERSAHKAYLRRKADDGTSADELARAKSASRAAGSWAPVMFATGFFVSVFFSFDALFDYVYVKDQQDLNNGKVARSTIGALFGTIEGKTREDRNAELKELRDSNEWKAWLTGLTAILNTAENSRDILQASWNSQRVNLEREVAGLRKQEADKKTQVAQLQAKLETAGQASQAGGQVTAADTDRTKDLQTRAASLQDAVTKLEQERSDLKVKRDLEAKIGQDGRPAGQGPVWTELGKKLTAVESALGQRQSDLAGVRRELANLQKEQESRVANAAQEQEKARASRGITAAEFDKAKREAADLERSVAEAEGRYKIFMGGAGNVTAATSGAGDMVVNVRRALTVFTGNGSRESFKTMFDGCSALTEILEREPQTKKLLGATSCDTSSFAQRVEKLAAFDAALEKYRKTCTVDDDFNALPKVKDMVDRGRSCASISGLPFQRIKGERADIDRIEQENSPNTSHFERTISTLRRGDVLAWLALAIAFSIDFLVLIAAMIGARAAISPLVRDGHVASQADIDDLSISQNIDLQIYPDDPPEIRNQKAFLSVAREGWDAHGDNKAGSVVDLQEVPLEFASGLSALLQTYTAKRLAWLDRRRPGVYHVESSLIMQMTRDVGLYERARRRMRARQDAEEGRLVKRAGAGRSMPWFGDFAEQPAGAGFRQTEPWTAPQAGNSNSSASSASNGHQPAAAGKDREQDGRGGWSPLRNDGGDTKKFFN